ncbi:MAG: DUF3795 domain-containing protein [Oscillospiraceae bacterium]|nr:DUF3795 domain-containing protein [Oscillospiraceae bacterium]
MPPVGYCGIDCERCGNYLKGANCLGCRVDQEMISDCETRDCCKQKGVGYCGECGSFPCASMKQFYEEKPQYAYALEYMKEIARIRSQKGKDIP